jgi:glycosyltransferase involved in cell wall biosynthesis
MFVNDRRKPLILIPSFKQGGVPQVYKHLLGAFPDLFYVAGNFNYDSELSRFYAKKSKGSTQVVLNKVSFRSIIAVRKLVRVNNINLVMSNGFSGAFYSMILPRTVKIFHTFHGFELGKGLTGLFQRIVLQILKKRGADFIAVSVSEKEEVESKTSVSNVDVIHNGLPVAIQRLSLEDALGIKLSDRINVVSLARINHQKDLKKLIALARDPWCLRFVSFYIIGGYEKKDGPYYNEIVSLANKMSNVYLLGEIDNASAYLHEFDVYLSTSRFEGLPTAILECFREHIPVVATPCRGNRDLVDSDTGWLSEDNRVESLLVQLRDCIKSQDLRMKRTRNARARFDNYFTIDAFIGSLTKKLKLD